MKPAGFAIRRLDAGAIVRRLAAEDALAMPILEPSFRLRLLGEARSVAYREARALVGPAGARVRQRMGVQPDVPTGGAFGELVSGFEALWDTALASVRPYPFESPLRFNDLMLQHYTVGEIGITAHRDHVEYRNLICLFVLGGRGRFCVCEDREGHGMRPIEHRPGDVVLTRAPGMLGSDRRPFHFVDHITEPRYVFGLRQDRRRSRDA